jgi:hypothetical protein
MSRIDLLNLHGLEKLKAAVDQFVFFRWEVLPHRGEAFYFELTGCFPPPVVKCGPNAGHPNWKRRDRSTEKVIRFSLSDHAAWICSWEQATGKCSECVGTGSVFASWSRDTGTCERPCKRCRGTGQGTQLGSSAEENVLKGQGGADIAAANHIE